MDHQAFLSSLPPDARAALVERSDRAGLLHLAGHLGAIALTGGLITAGWWWLVPVQGVLVVFLFTLEHEATHKTPFAGARLNETAGHACGFLLLLPFGWFRLFHLAHHRHTNLPGDPELASPKPRTLRQWIWHVGGVPYWASQARLVWRLAMGRERAAYLPDGALPRLAAEARWMLAGYAACAASLFVTPVLFWVWVAPVLLGQPVLRLYLLAEHGDCPQVADMFLNTRTTFTTAAVRFVAWNMPYHAEHHVFPSVPFHRLPDLHLLMRGHLGVTAPGYARFTRQYLARRKVSGQAGGTDSRGDG